MKRRADWLLIFLLIGVLCATTLVGENRSADEQRMKAPSTRNFAPAGMAAMFKLLEQEGVPIARLETPWTKLSTKQKALVVAEPLLREIGKDEYAALKSWIEKGGTCILFGQSAPGGIALTSLGLDDVDVSFGSPTLRMLKPNARKAKELKGVQEVAAEGLLRLQWKGETEDATELVRDDNGVLALKVSMGDGKVFIFSDAIRPQNNQLSRADNALFLTNVLTSRAGSVYFDEYHQGAGARVDSSATLWSAIGSSGRFATYYILALVAILVLVLNRRFGSTIKTAGVKLRPQTDYVTSMARLLQRGNGSSVVLQSHERAFRQEIARQTDVDQAADPDQLAQAYHKFTGRPRDIILNLFSRSETMTRQQGQARDSELLELATAFQFARKDLQLDRHSL